MAQRLPGSEMLARIIDGSSIASFVINRQHKVIYWNTAIEALTGIEREEIIGTDQQWRAFYSAKRPTLADLIVNQADEREIESYYPHGHAKSRLIEGAHEAEDFFHELGGGGAWLRFTASPIKDNNNAIIGAIETLEDVTENKIAENALHESEKSFRALFEGAYDAIWVHDMDGIIQTANNAAAELSGYPLQELMGMDIRSFLNDETSLKIARAVSAKLLQNERIDAPYEQKITRKDGSIITIMVTTNLVTTDGEPKGFQHTARDVTHEKLMEENLRYYLQQITRAQEEERKRIARELHDDTAQVLGSLARQIDNFLRNEQGFTPSQTAFLKSMEEQLNRGVQGVHRFSQDLRPSLLDDLGLIPALRSMLKSVQEYDGISTDLKILGEERRLSPEVELLLFRVVQEAITNIRKHAAATEAGIAVRFSSDRIEVIITDNGQGFELSERLEDLPRSGKLGLIGMQERARLMGGTLNITSVFGKGTRVVVKLPLLIRG
jgi:two-component system sensor histidine kinase DegS